MATLLGRFFTLALFALLTVPSVVAAASMPITGWAWSTGTDKASGVSMPFQGWIHFGGGGVSYGVKEDTVTGALSGYAWSSNLGWITFNAAEVTGCPSGTCAPAVNLSNGNLTGWARACAVFANKNACSGALDANVGTWDGWIHLGGANYQTVQNKDCTWSGAAWGSDAIGYISFTGSLYSVGGTLNDPTCSGGPGKADLTVVSFEPATAVVGQSTTLKATISNTGTAATPSSNPSFQSTVFVCTDGDTACTSAVDSAVIGMSPLRKMLSFFMPHAEAATAAEITLGGPMIAAGASGTQTGSYTFMQAGTFKVRSCADKPKNDVLESNDNNNCGAWQTLTVDQAPLCATTHYGCNPGTSGSNTYNSGTYTWTCTTGVGTISCSEVFNPTGTLTASPNRVQKGAASTLTWSSTGATSCSIKKNNGAWKAGLGISGTTSTGALTTQTSFTLVCTASDGVTLSTPVTAVVNVVPIFSPF